jgi:hypothetical protein
LKRQSEASGSQGLYAYASESDTTNLQSSIVNIQFPLVRDWTLKNGFFFIICMEEWRTYIYWQQEVNDGYRTRFETLG